MASDSKVHHDDNGTKLVVESGGRIETKSGATVDFSAGTVTLPAVPSGLALTGAGVGNAADDNLVGAVPVVHRLSIADGATGDIDYVLTHKTRVLDVWLVKTGAAGHATEDTITVKNGATAITEAIVLGGVDKGIKRASTIDDASWEIAAAGTLRITRTKGAFGGNNVECTVYVHGLRVA